ncbi:MAG TPA: MFS transporter [Candidatus Dormibacteraeota bacterium]
MRITVLAIPPVVVLIHRDLGLSETGVGVLTALPTLLFAAAAVGGAWLTSKLGARRAVIAGLAVVAVAGALRGVGPSLAMLFGMTFAMGVGISLVQPAFPVLVRLWAPARIGLATAIYSIGLLIGEGVPPTVTGPLLLPRLGGWQQTLAVWSIPVAAGALLIALFAPAASGEPIAAPRWWPDWRSSRTWRLGLMLGGDSALYWSCNSFIPDLLQHTGRAGLVTPALIALNVGQIPAGLVIATLPEGLLSRRAAYWLPGLLLAAGVVALVFSPGLGPVVVAAGIGFLSAWIFVLALALPPLLAEAADVSRMAAAMFTITYVCSFCAALLGGAAWDTTHTPALAFLPGLVATGLVAFMAAGLRLPAQARTEPVPPV